MKDVGFESASQSTSDTDANLELELRAEVDAHNTLELWVLTGTRWGEPWTSGELGWLAMAIGDPYQHALYLMVNNNSYFCWH